MTDRQRQIYNHAKDIYLNEGTDDLYCWEVAIDCTIEDLALTDDEIDWLVQVS